MLKDQVIEWVRNYLNSFGGNTKAVIGISGGKDSTIAAKICVEAVGKDRVLGVLLPQNTQHDIDVSKKVVEYLGIESVEINIGSICKEFDKKISDEGYFYLNNLKNKVPEEIRYQKSYVYSSNMPARVRMTMLYAVAAMIGDSRVVNTCNRSEDYIGYSTKFGDAAGDFSILSSLTVREVKQLGYELGVPKEFIEKKPEDGLSGKTDEDNLGFTYETLDAYLLDGIEPKKEILDKIERLHKSNLHKLEPMPKFKKSNLEFN